MPHSAPITRSHPTAFVLLIDQSGSMAERIVFEGAEMTKARAVSVVANSFIDELLYRARREKGVADYYDLAALGYSGAGICSLLSPRGEFALPSRLAAAQVRREKISRERLLPSGRSVVAAVERNVWIEPSAVGATPMCGALTEGLRLAERWCRSARGRDSYPPTVINITDGEASDGGADEVCAVAERLRATGTADGSTTLLNIHLAQGGDDTPVIFPRHPDELPDHRYARLLWDISSEMPDGYAETVRGMRGESAEEAAEARGFRALGWRCGIGAVAAMMNIGSVNSVMI